MEYFKAGEAFGDAVAAAVWGKQRMLGNLEMRARDAQASLH